MRKPILCPSVVVPLEKTARALENWRDFLEFDGQILLDLATVAPISDEKLLQISRRENIAPVRIAGTCQSAQCGHFSSGKCHLARRIADEFAPVVNELPHCEIRGRCRWWRQEGAAACLACPGVETISKSSKERA